MEIADMIEDAHENGQPQKQSSGARRLSAQLITLAVMGLLLKYVVGQGWWRSSRCGNLAEGDMVRCSR